MCVCSHKNRTFHPPKPHNNFRCPLSFSARSFSNKHSVQIEKLHYKLSPLYSLCHRTSFSVAMLPSLGRPFSFRRILFPITGLFASVAKASLYTASSEQTHMSFRKVPAETLFVSEPNPAWFGNGPNESTNKNWNNSNWLKSRFHFSFAEYHDPQRSQFGVLRVMNDDLVQPKRGFGTHPHSNMEIVTYIIDGHLTHQDSMGTKETLDRGSIQFMTAGTGVMHSEHNLHDKDPLRFIQIWITPRSRGLNPNYGSMLGDESVRKNKWAHLVSDVKDTTPTPVKINQDANIFVTELDPKATVDLLIKPKRMAYLLCMEGSALVAGAHGDESMSRHDGGRVIGENNLTITAKEKAHFLVVEMEKRA
eukprot:comp5226_c0_seq1/m.1262 comp5226_c0_seq1/g.1262  ORF comp5226_c0_seq1/g.1262 comp5226_c0_seq1/m.1262 type:complete len:363 (-) comp5226_c0_seq1:342-1430(-)